MFLSFWGWKNILPCPPPRLARCPPPPSSAVLRTRRAGAARWAGRNGSTCRSLHGGNGLKIPGEWPEDIRKWHPKKMYQSLLQLRSFTMQHDDGEPICFRITQTTCEMRLSWCIVRIMNDASSSSSKAKPAKVQLFWKTIADSNARWMTPMHYAFKYYMRLHGSTNKNTMPSSSSDYFLERMEQFTHKWDTLKPLANGNNQWLVILVLTHFSWWYSNFQLVLTTNVRRLGCQSPRACWFAQKRTVLSGQRNWWKKALALDNLKTDQHI